MDKTLIINALSDHYSNGNDADFARKLGITPQNLSNWKKRNTLDYEIIYTKCEDVNPEWLLTGGEKGEMIKTDIVRAETILNSRSRRKTIGNTTLVPYYDVDFVAGNSVQFYSSTEAPDYEMDIPEFAGCVAFRVYNDSMEPLLKSGSVVFGRKLEGWGDYIEYGQIYGIVMRDNRRFLKYLRRSQNDDKFFTARSHNKEYDDFELPKDKIHNLWLIEGWMQKRT